MARFSLAAVGVDRPGIVAGLSGALADAGCNLEDSTMAILQGQFAVLLVVDVPDGTDPADVEAALSATGRALDLAVSLRPLPAGPAPAAAEGEPWVVSVHGADRPGIVHAVTAALAAAGGNVVDLATHLIDGADGPVYVLTLRATLPAGAAAESAARAVTEAADAVGVHCTVHRDDADVL